MNKTLILNDFNYTHKRVTVLSSLAILLFSILVLFSNDTKAQQYKLLPDSCTYCHYLEYSPAFQMMYHSYYKPSYYYINPSDTIEIEGDNYQIIKFNAQSDTVQYIIQIGNKVYGRDHISDTANHLLMDFDTEVGDTIFNLKSVILGYPVHFANYPYYYAVVLEKDSIQNSLGNYVQFTRSNGHFQIDSWQTSVSEIVWFEKGLCTWSGGYLFNRILTSIDYGNYLYGTAVTCDPLYPNPNGTSCNNCIAEMTILNVNNIVNLPLKIFPNPTQNEFYISLENSNEPNLPFKIVDISGKIVLQSFANSNSAIDISNLPNGYYIVQVNVGEQFVSKSLIVNR
jgi:hypothetical protein